MRFKGRLVILAAIAALAAGLIATVAGGGGRAAGDDTGTLLRPAEQGGPRGLAYVSQRGRVVSGWVVVTGLEPGSEHAWHIHGPAGACTPASRNKGVVVPFSPDLRADDNGVAWGDIKGRATTNVVRRGFYLNVHVVSSADMAGASITCGNLR